MDVLVAGFGSRERSHFTPTIFILWMVSDKIQHPIFWANPIAFRLQSTLLMGWGTG
jgi:hypothetical protein